MKFTLLFLALVYSQLTFARTISQDEAKIFTTDESCDVKASFIITNNSPVIVVRLEDGGQSIDRELTLDIVEGRDYYRTYDDQLPTLEVLMPIRYKDELPLLSVFYSGRYVSCSMKQSY